MKVANILIVHKNPGQLNRLINQYDPELFHHFVHVDRKCDLKDFDFLKVNSSVTLMPHRQNVVWAGYGTVGVIIDAFRLIRKRKEHFFYINVMSGMDFPIKPTFEFYQFLQMAYKAGPKEFFEILDLRDWPGSHRRYERYHLTGWTFKGRYFAEWVINSLIQKREFYRNKLKPYGRAAWFTTSDHFVDYVLKYIDEHKEYIKFLKTVWNPDEFAFTTLVMNSQFKDKIMHYLRVIDWSEKKAHPKVMRVSDFESLHQSGCYIARKFDESIDTEIIRKIEEEILIPGRKSNVSPNE